MQRFDRLLWVIIVEHLELFLKVPQTTPHLRAQTAENELQLLLRFQEMSNSLIGSC